MSRLAIYGAGGFGREVATAARGRQVVFVCDDPLRNFSGFPVIGLDELLPDDELVIAVADSELRRKLASRCTQFGSVIAPTAVVGKECSIGEGAILCDFTMVTASATIGRHFHGNIYSYVAHDCVVGDFVTFAPRVCCNGSVKIGDGAYIGTSAMIRQGISVGANAIVGMGAVVTKDVPAGATVVGNPARPIERREAGRSLRQDSPRAAISTPAPSA